MTFLTFEAQTQLQTVCDQSCRKDRESGGGCLLPFSPAPSTGPPQPPPPPPHSLCLNIYILANSGLSLAETLFCFCPRVKASFPSVCRVRRRSLSGHVELSGGKGPRGVELPYKEWNKGKDPGQLPASATTNQSLCQHQLKTTEGCQVGILPGRMPVRPRHGTACFPEENFLEFSSWTNQTFWS